jgi:hypothetical protein
MNEIYDNNYEASKLAHSGSITNTLLSKVITKQSSVEHQAQNSPTSSSKSHKRIKDIKNSVQLKKKQSSDSNNNISSPLQNEFNERSIILPSSNSNKVIEDEEEYFKQMLSSSFTKRRDRKGSLPEINSSHVMAGGAYAVNEYEPLTVSPPPQSHPTAHNPDMTVLTNQTSHSNESHLLYSPGSTLQNESIIIEPSGGSSQQQQQQQHQSRRNGRKNGAFVLEVARQSMFRSKSMTDLSNSLVRFDNHATNSQHMNSGYMVASSYKNSSQKSFNMMSSQQPGTSSKIDFNDLYFNINMPISNK